MLLGTEGAGGCYLASKVVLAHLHWILLYPLLQTFGLLMISGLEKGILQFHQDCKGLSSIGDGCDIWLLTDLNMRTRLAEEPHIQCPVNFGFNSLNIIDSR